MKSALCILVFTVVSLSAVADTRYVTDQLYITLRSGPQSDAPVTKTIKTGDAAEVLEAQGENVRVRMADGTEGWVRAKYLESKQPSAAALDGAQKRSVQLEKENAELKTKLNELNNELKELAKTHGSLEKDNAKLNKDLERVATTAAKPLELDQQNQELRTANEKMTAELEELRTQVASHTDSSDREWFVAGGGVVVLGLIIGLIIPRLRFRRRSDYWA